MRILKSSNQKNKSVDRFAGFHIDPEADSLISLWALSEGSSRASLLRTFVKDKLKAIDPINLVSKKANRLFSEARMSEQSFILALKDDMRSKAVSEEDIEAVIERFKQQRRKANAKG
jgi:hypothetical protein